jgi:ketosteroid isomerase-like protein
VSQANVEVVREAYELLRRGDPRRLLELVAADAVWEPVAGSRVRPTEGGREVAKTFMWRGTVHRFRVVEAIDLGDRVLVRLAGRRLLRLGGQPWKRRFFHVVTLRGGQIVRIEDYGTRDQAFAAVGLTA